MLTQAEIDLIRAEVADDPAGLGYAADPARVYGLLTWTDTGSRRLRPRVSKSEFLLAIAPAAFRIAQLDANSQRAWDRVLGMIQAAESVSVSDLAVQGMLAAGVQQGVITQAEADALSYEPCPRIEVVLGRHVLISPDDLQAALEV